MRPDRPLDPDDPRWLISALADGESDAAEALRALQAWAEADPAACSRWHAYHLIGDVLRSSDLASAPECDRRFLDRLRTRLAAEPVSVLDAAPAIAYESPPLSGSWPEPLPALPAAAPRRARWAMPVALAAGLLALATALLVQRPPGPEAASRVLAEARPQAVPAASSAMVAAAPTVGAAGSRIVRDAQLDRYLRAHREYAAAQPVSLPGGSGRSLETVGFDR